MKIPFVEVISINDCYLFVMKIGTAWAFAVLFVMFMLFVAFLVNLDWDQPIPDWENR